MNISHQSSGTWRHQGGSKLYKDRNRAIPNSRSLVLQGPDQTVALVVLNTVDGNPKDGKVERRKTERQKTQKTEDPKDEIVEILERRKTRKIPSRRQIREGATAAVSPSNAIRSVDGI